jgi:hypothetical protein
MVARLCAVAFIAFASLLLVSHGIAVAADDSYGQSDDSYLTPDAAEHPAAPDDGSTPPPEDDTGEAAPYDDGGGHDASAPPPPEKPY